jgi:L,D-transpeptidase catalytic domain
MRFLFVALAGAMLFAGHSAQANVAITVDKNTQTMTVAIDGVERYNWPVSTGIPSRETPNGSFRAFRMEEDHYSKEFDDAPMPHSIFFTKIGHAIHGTDSVNRLGTPASHGCVRLSRDNATTLYALVEQQGVLNTTVTLTGSAQIALARMPRRVQPAVAGLQRPSDEQQYSAAGEPVDITPPPVIQSRPLAPQVRADDGYIYPADGSADARYPSPRRRLYDAQAYPQPQNQYYNNNPGYAQPDGPQPYYQQRRSYPPRGF